MNPDILKEGASLRRFAFQNVSFDYYMIYQARRTLSVTVYPTQDLVVKAPFGTTAGRIEDFLRRKTRWVLKQKRYFAQFKIPRPKQYVSGESFRYRGRSYKLLVRCGTWESVSLTHGTLRVLSKRPNEPEHTRAMLEKWFLERARIVFEERLRECFALFDYTEMPGLAVRRMRRRWGSYSLKTRRVNLNAELIRASTRYIDYVIIHELCHVTYRKHDRAFYELLESKLPAWKDLKTELELSLLG